MNEAAADQICGTRPTLHVYSVCAGIVLVFIEAFQRLAQK